MQLKAKINHKKYLLLSIPSTTLCFILANSVKEYFGISVIYITTVLNQIVLVRASELYLSSSDDSHLKSGKKVLMLFAIKMGVLFLGLSLGIHLMGKRVIIPLLNYLILIVILGFSIKRIEKQ